MTCDTATGPPDRRPQIRPDPRRPSLCYYRVRKHTTYTIRYHYYVRRRPCPCPARRGESCSVQKYSHSVPSTSCPSRRASPRLHTTPRPPTHPVLTRSLCPHPYRLRSSGSGRAHRLSKLTHDEASIPRRRDILYIRPAVSATRVRPHPPDPRMMLRTSLTREARDSQALVVCLTASTQGKVPVGSPGQQPHMTTRSPKHSCILPLLPVDLVVACAHGRWILPQQVARDGVTTDIHSIPFH